MSLVNMPSYYAYQFKDDSYVKLDYGSMLAHCRSTSFRQCWPCIHSFQHIKGFVFVFSLCKGDSIYTQTGLTSGLPCFIDNLVICIAENKKQFLYCVQMGVFSWHFLLLKLHCISILLFNEYEFVCLALRPSVNSQHLANPDIGLPL